VTGVHPCALPISKTVNALDRAATVTGSERAKTVHALDRAATVTGVNTEYFCVNIRNNVCYFIL
jgi:hypothetical protein